MSALGEVVVRGRLDRERWRIALETGLRPAEVLREETIDAWVARVPWPREAWELDGLPALTRRQRWDWGERLLAATKVGGEVGVRRVRGPDGRRTTLEEDVRAAEEALGLPAPGPEPWRPVWQRRKRR